jgi:cell division protein FtsB
MRKKLVTLVILIIGISLIVNLSRDILHLLKAGDQIEKAEEKLTEEEKEHRELVEKEEYFQSPEFIEEEARNKLNMAREGETIVILPPNIEEMTKWMKPETKEDDLPNWKKWWNLFF